MKKSKNYVTARTPMEFGKMLGLSTKDIIKGELQVNLIIAIERTIKRNKWTQEQVAKKANVSEKVIKSLLNGDITEVSVEQLIDIAHELGLQIKLKVA